MAQMFNEGKKKLWEGEIDLVDDTIKGVFMDTSYTFDADGDENYDDISAEIASGASAFTLANKTITRDDTNDITVFDADDVSQSGVTMTSDSLILYKDTGVVSTSTLIAYIDVTERSPVGGDVDIEWNSDGIFSY